MTELPPQLNVAMKYPLFMQDVRKTLQLTHQETTVASAATPETWAYWATASLSEENIAYIEPSQTSSFFPNQDSLAFFAGEADFRGRQVFDFRAGDLSKKVRRLYETKNPESQKRFKQFSEQAAMFTFILSSVMGGINSQRFREIAPYVPQTSLAADRDTGKMSVRFGSTETNFAVDEPLDSIVTFGPGMSGGTLASLLIGKTREIHYVSGGKGAHFVNTWIKLANKAIQAGLEMNRHNTQLTGLLPPGVDPETAQMPKASYYHKGIAQSTRQIKRREIDAVIMSSVHTAGLEECTAGVEFAANSLRVGGLFILKAPDISIGTEGGLDKLSVHAQRAFGSPAVAGACGRLQQHSNPSLPLERSASFAIYQKQ